MKEKNLDNETPVTQDKSTPRRLHQPRPIIMSGDNPKLILEGRKTQTRRITHDPEAKAFYWVDCQPTFPDSKGYSGWVAEYEYCSLLLPRSCPFGVAGERLWVRETFAVMNKEAFALRRPAPYGLRYKADSDTATTLSFRPSIHMPRWASRITLEITKVRVERLQDISEEDAKAEGLYPNKSKNPTAWTSDNGAHWHSTAINAYARLWDSLHGKGAWDKNPWVWVLEFWKI